MKHLFFIIFIVTFSCVEAQKQANVWCFGAQAGVDFNSGIPVSFNGVDINAIEGSASVADVNGNLLSYCDGLVVRDNDHNIMPNGSAMAGGSSSVQPALYVPKPGSSSIIYLFTLGSYGAQFGVQLYGLSYSEIDMTLNNGKGDVTLNKNIELQPSTYEGISAVHHPDGERVWVITHPYNSSEFWVYQVTTQGVNENPVVADVGPFIGGGTSSLDALGAIKVSPNGCHVALTNFDSIRPQLMEFDPITGMLTNALDLGATYDGMRTYGVSFSASSDVLYIGGVHRSDQGTQEIYQYDLLAPDIVASETLVASYSGNTCAMQLAPDGKIYVATSSNSSALSVINNPNVIGLGCGFDLDVVDLSPGGTNTGLPSFIESYFKDTSVAPCYEYIPEEEVEDEWFVPSSFSPNNDEINDVFLPVFSVRDTLGYQLDIFNRWGELIFTTTNELVGWDGTKNGTASPSGMYLYVIQRKDEEARSGRILLNR